MLAAAYAASGRFEEAQAACRRAVSLAAGTPAAGEIAGRLDLYGRKRRYVSRASSP